MFKGRDFVILAMVCFFYNACGNQVTSIKRVSSFEPVVDDMVTGSEVTTDTVNLGAQFKVIHFTHRKDANAIPVSISIERINEGNVTVNYSFARSGLTSQHFAKFDREMLVCQVKADENIQFVHRIFNKLANSEAYIYDPCRRTINSTGLISTVCDNWEDTSFHYLQFLTAEEESINAEGLTFHFYESSSLNGPGNYVLNHPQSLERLFDDLMSNAKTKYANDCLAPDLNSSMVVTN